jgi:hypothetical protein
MTLFFFSFPHFLSSADMVTIYCLCYGPVRVDACIIPASHEFVGRPSKMGVSERGLGSIGPSTTTGISTSNKKGTKHK